MFKLQPNPTFKAKVPISVPGQADPVHIEVEYKHMGREALREFFAQAGGKADTDLLPQIVVGWAGVDQAYSPQALATLLDNFPAAAGSLFETFRNELFEARRKN